MNKLVRITNALHGTAFASVVVGDGLIKVFPASPDAEEWSIWAQEQCKTLDEINDSLGYAYQSELPVPVTEENQILIKSLIGDSQISDVMDFASESSLELIHSFGTNVRRFAVKNLPSDEYSVTSMGIREFVPSSRQLVIDYKAMSFLSESTYSDVSYHVKKARALWDPDLGPGGGWRCPPGTQFGGYITDRFGRGCGGGALRRVGRALINAGRGIDKLGERAQLGRLNRAANRAQRTRANVGRVGRAVVGLERGAQRVLRGGREVARTFTSGGRSTPFVNEPNIGAPGGRVGRAVSRLTNLPNGTRDVPDVVPGEGRRGRRRIGRPEVSRERRDEINSRLVAIRDEMDELEDKPRTPNALRRQRELMDENRKLRAERDGLQPKRTTRVAPARDRRRIIKPAAGERRQRRQGEKPKKKPVAERRREGILERAAQGLVGDYRPDEYKPGDKRRIRERKNRYADASDAQLKRALAANSPKKARPGEKREVEARRRQERLEVLQEMVNRGMDIPEEYKREVRQYRLKRTRDKRRDGLNRQGRAAVGLERAAQRVEKRRPRRPADRDAIDNMRFPGRDRDTPGSGRIDIVEARRKYIDALEADLAKAKKEAKRKRPEGVSDENWDAYKKYVDSQKHAFGRGGADRLASIMSYDDWAKRNNRDNRETTTPRLDIQSNRPAPTPRGRRRVAVSERNNVSSLRRPQPKRFQGDSFDMSALDREQKTRMRNLLKDEKASLDAEWRKRLGLARGDEITDRAIKDYIKQREGNKPGAYIGTLKAKANDWKVLNEWQKEIDRRSPGSSVTGESDSLNRLGPKRRNGVIQKFNRDVPAISRSGKQRPAETAPSKRLVPRPTDNSVEADVVASHIQTAISELNNGSGLDGQSLPDSRSRRNVNNRFPRNGLPDTAFWRETGWFGRNENDRDAHERRFGRYYGDDGKINARGRLINRQLQERRERAVISERSNSKRASEAASAGRRIPKASTAPKSSRNTIDLVREHDEYKKLDERLKNTEPGLRQRWDAAGPDEVSDLADAIKMYDDTVKQAGDTIKYMRENAVIEGANAEIMAANLAHHDHAERMREHLFGVMEKYDASRALRLRNRKGITKLSDETVTRKPSTDASVSRRAALVNQIEKRWKRDAYDALRGGSVYKKYRRAWEKNFNDTLADIQEAIDEGRLDDARAIVDRKIQGLEDDLNQFTGRLIENDIAFVDARVAHAKAAIALLRGSGKFPENPKTRRTGSAVNAPSAPSTPNAPAPVSGAKNVIALDELQKPPTGFAPHNPKRVEQRMGKKVVGGIFVPDPVQKGSNGIDTRVKAAKHLKDGGSLDSVPDDFLKQAILTNAAFPGEPTTGRRFILEGDPGDGINNRNQRRKADKTYVVRDTLTGKTYILKTPTFQPDEYIGEQLAETIGQMAGRPMARIRVASQVEMKAGFGRNADSKPSASILVEHFGDVIDFPDIEPGDARWSGEGDQRAESMMRFIDAFIGNPDRHSGNYLWAGEEILPIDHGVWGARDGADRRALREFGDFYIDELVQDYPDAVKNIGRFSEQQIEEIVDSLRFQWELANGGNLPDNAKATVESLRKNLLALRRKGSSL